MNYQSIYDSLIARGQTRTITGYSEKHHILPRCLGGLDDASNLVRLTAEEHYVAHQLLVKIHPCSGDLIYATNMMTVTNLLQSRSKNKMYGWLRKRFSDTHRKTMVGRFAGDKNPNYGITMPEDQKEKIRNTLSGRFDGDKNPNYGKTCDPTTRKKISDSMKGKLVGDKNPMRLDKNKGILAGSKNPMFIVWQDPDRKQEIRNNMKKAWTPERLEKHLKYQASRWTPEKRAEQAVKSKEMWTPNRMSTKKVG